jgi:transposase-like protein
MDSLDRLIEARELDVRCPHCHANNVRTLGWLRDRQEMSCAACDELIVLGTAELRTLIRTTSRQLRDLNEQLRTQFRCWS